MTIESLVQTDKDYAKFKLTTHEWDKLNQMMKFLKPLNDATNMLCGSTYPTLGAALPVYIILIMQLEKVSNILTILLI